MKYFSTILIALMLFLGSSESVFAVGWTTVNDLNVSRRNHTATLLPSGKVLVAGGEPLVVGSETYDPSTTSWSYAGTLSASRYDHTAHLVTISGGAQRVIAIGGTGSGGTLGSVESFNPSSNTWSSVTSLNNQRTMHASVLLNDGTVLATGGYGVGSYMTHVEQYDPVNNTWTNKSSLNTGRNSHTATVLSDGKVLVAGGTVSTGQTTAVEIYDPSANTWTNATSMNVARADHTATLLPNGKVLVVGGANSSGSSNNSAEVYDPTNNSWTNTPTLSYSHKNRHTATLVTLSDGTTQKVLIAGGGAFITGAELYDYSNNTWSTTSSLSYGRQRHSATLMNNGKVLVTGGLTASGSTNKTEYYTTP